MESLWSLASSFQNQVVPITERSRAILQQNPGLEPTYHARILRHVQLRVYDYLQSVAISVGDTCDGVEVPRFQALLRNLKDGTFHHSNQWAPLPEAYMQEARPSNMGGSSIPGSVRTSTTGTTASSQGSAVSSITGATGTAGGATPRAAVSRVDNPTDDTEFSSLTLRGGIGSILRANRPPANDAGHEFCVAWWCKRGCFPSCGRRATHVPFASPAERTRLLTFVRSNLVAAPSASAT